MANLGRTFAEGEMDGAPHPKTTNAALPRLWPNLLALAIATGGLFFDWFSVVPDHAEKTAHDFSPGKSENPLSKAA